MKLLFNLEGMEGKCIRARRVGYPQSLPPAEQVATISEFLQRAGHGRGRERQQSTGPRRNRCRHCRGKGIPAKIAGSYPGHLQRQATGGTT